MIFYILAGLSISFYITMTSVYPSVSLAIKAGIVNTFTNNRTLAVSLNILFLTIIWPIVIPYFFSANFRDAMERGFDSAIYAED